MKPVGITDIPRADAQIQRTIQTLRVAQFAQDPLFDAADSFRISLCNSAIKREGGILEAAIMDAIDQTDHLTLLPVDRSLKRIHDVYFNTQSLTVALEIKRGVLHDSKALRQFRADLNEPLSENTRFHIVFLSGKPPLSEGWIPAHLEKFYGLCIQAHILTARQRYSSALKNIMRERGL